MNFLEQLVAEWYEYNHYFVRTNIRIGRRLSGGYDGEIDIAAFQPKDKSLLHIETSTDNETWNHRIERFQRKFAVASKCYKEIFDFEFTSVKQQVIIGYTERKTPINIGKGIKVIIIPQFMRLICGELKQFSPSTRAVPECYPLLRAVQFTVHYGFPKNPK